MTRRFESTFHKVTASGISTYHLSLEEIPAAERAGKELLGTAVGRDLWHCVHLGARYADNFFERARWYFINPEDDEHLTEMRRCEPETMLVEFYGEKHG